MKLKFRSLCVNCHHIHQWRGTKYQDMPPCPNCSFRPDQEVLDEAPALQDETNYMAAELQAREAAVRQFVRDPVGWLARRDNCQSETRGI